MAIRLYRPPSVYAPLADAARTPYNIVVHKRGFPMGSERFDIYLDTEHRRRLGAIAATQRTSLTDAVRSYLIEKSGG